MLLKNYAENVVKISCTTLNLFSKICMYVNLASVGLIYPQTFILSSMVNKYFIKSLMNLRLPLGPLQGEFYHRMSGGNKIFIFSKHHSSEPNQTQKIFHLQFIDVLSSILLQNYFLPEATIFRLMATLTKLSAMKILTPSLKF